MDTPVLGGHPGHGIICILGTCFIVFKIKIYGKIRANIRKMGKIRMSCALRDQKLLWKYTLKLEIWL